MDDVAVQANDHNSTTVCAKPVLLSSTDSWIDLLADIAAMFCVAILLFEVDGCSIQSHEVSSKIC